MFHWSVSSYTWRPDQMTLIHQIIVLRNKQFDVQRVIICNEYRAVLCERDVMACCCCWWWWLSWWCVVLIDRCWWMCWRTSSRRMSIGKRQVWWHASSGKLHVWLWCWVWVSSELYNRLHRSVGLAAPVIRLFPYQPVYQAWASILATVDWELDIGSVWKQSLSNHRTCLNI